MRKAVLSITVFGVYLAGVGIGFFLVPNLILLLLGFATTTEVWIRLAGLLRSVQGMYFLYGARQSDVALGRKAFRLLRNAMEEIDWVKNSTLDVKLSNKAFLRMQMKKLRAPYGRTMIAIIILIESI